MRKLLTTFVATCAVAVAAIAYFHFVPFESSQDDENEMKMDAEAGEGGDYSDYWISRATYPTGKFDAQWVVAAAQQERQMAAQVPAGVKTYSKAKFPGSPLALDPGGFVPLGPMPENNTQQTYGHISGRSNVIRVDPTNTTPGSITVYSGSDGGGIWKTTNCCTPTTTWEVVTDVPEVSSMSISDIALDPHDHNTIYAGTGDLNFGSFSFGAAGVLKSSDAGQNWQLLGADVFSPYYSGSFNSFPQYQAVGKVAVDPNNSNNVMAGTKTSLYISNDAGNTWAQCFTNQYALPNNAVSVTAQRQDVTGLIPVSNGDGTTRLYVAIGTRGSPTPVQPDLVNTGSNGVYVLPIIPASGCPAISAWTLLNNGWPAALGNGVASATPIGRIEIAVAPSNAQRMYAEAEDTATKKINSFYRSDDAGAHWLQTSTGAGLNNNGTNPGCETNSNNGGAQMWYDAGLTVDPNNADRVWMSTIDATVSSDGGMNYYDVTCGYGSHSTNGGTRVHVDHHARAFVGNDSTQMLLGSDGGVYYSANADVAVTSSTASNTMTWIGLNDTINSIEFYFGDITSSFATSPLPAIGAGAQDNGCSRVGFSGAPIGATLWTSNCSGDGTTTKIEPIKNGYWFNSSQYGSLARAGSAATPYYNTTTGVFSGNFSNAAANTGGTWGGDPSSVIFAMSYNIYKWGVLDAPGSPCTTASGCNHMIAGTTRLWETIDATNPTTNTMRASWKARTPDLTKDSLNINYGAGVDIRSYINYVDYSFTDPSVAAVGTNDGNMQIVFGLGTAATANCPVTPPADPLNPNCANAVNVTDSNNVLPNRPIFGVRFDPTTPLVAYAAVGGFNPNTPGHPGHVFQITCTANCATFQWKDKTGNLPDIPAEQVMPNPNFPQQVFVGTDWGLYYTDDITQDSPQWFRFESFPHVMVWELVVDRGFTTLAVFTRSRGAWVWPLPNAVLSTSADVAVTNSGPTTVSAGSNVAYTIKVRNSGPNTASNVVLSDPTPTGLSVVSVTGDCAALPCTFPSLAAGDNRTTTVTFAVPAAYNVATPIANIASVSGPVDDATPSNNSATATTTVTDKADLSLSMTGPATIARGANVTYTIVLANAGPSSAHNVSVADATPAGLTFVSTSGDCASAFPCSFASLDPGVPKQITATFSVPAAYAGASTIANIASATSTDTDPVATNNSAEVDTVVGNSADLTIGMTGPGAVLAGNSLTYAITLTNSGPSTAHNVSVADLTPTGLAFVSTSGDCATAFPCTFASLDSGVVKHVTATFSVPVDYAGASPIVDIASVSSDDPDPVSANNSAEVDSTVGSGADLAVSQNGTGAVLAGGNVIYTITVSNNGPSTATAVTIDDPTPTGLNGVSVTGDCAAFPCNVASMAPGDVKSIVATFSVPADYAGNQISNVANVTSAVGDPNINNNVSITSTTVGAGSDLALSVTAADTIPLGGSLVYTFTLVNNGPSVATDVQLNGTLASGLVFASNSGDCTNAFPCTFGSLQPGDTRSVTTTACVPSNYSGNYLIVSSATASSSSADANTGNNAATAYTSLLFDVLFRDGFETCP